MPGDISDMMLDGTLCEGCGVLLEGDGDGFPRYCSKECATNRGVSNKIHSTTPPRNPAKAACPTCGKHVKAVGLKDHQRDAHGVKS